LSSFFSVFFYGIFLVDIWRFPPLFPCKSNLFQQFLNRDSLLKQGGQEAFEHSEIGLVAQKALHAPDVSAREKSGRKTEISARCDTAMKNKSLIYTNRTLKH